MFRDGAFDVVMEKMNPNGATKITNGTEVGLFTSNFQKIHNSGSFFESARATVKVTGGKWFYEAKMNSYGKFHFGWYQYFHLFFFCYFGGQELNI
jgi:hypothetical protein